MNRVTSIHYNVDFASGVVAARRRLYRWLESDASSEPVITNGALVGLCVNESQSQTRRS